MASREVVINECDLCGKSDRHDGRIVDTHEIVVDGIGVEAEFCEICWDRKFLRTLAPLHQVGRPLSQLRRQINGKRKKKASAAEAAPAFSG